MRLTPLPMDDYAKIQDLCAPFHMHLAVIAMLAGEAPAQVYVDAIGQPSVALLVPWNKHSVFLAGEPTDEMFIHDIRELFFSLLSPSSDETITRAFALYYAAPQWEAWFPILCEGMETLSAMRHCYIISPVSAIAPAPIRDGWKLRTVDEALLAEQHLQRLPQLIEEIHSEAPSVEDFLARKFGYVLQEGTDLIGWCLSEYNHGERCEVGIETVETHRKQGVAVITASALIAHGRSLGITEIGWHCWANNAASIVLARKLGGVLREECPVLLCRLAQRDG